jgi:hypothetical protein
MVSQKISRSNLPSSFPIQNQPHTPTTPLTSGHRNLRVLSNVMQSFETQSSIFPFWLGQGHGLSGNLWQGSLNTELGVAIKTGLWLTGSNASN